MNSSFSSFPHDQGTSHATTLNMKPLIQNEDLVWSKRNAAAQVCDLTGDDPQLAACLRLIARTFAAEKMSLACGADEKVLLAFLNDTLAPILEDELSAAAFSVGNREPVAFCLQLALKPQDKEEDLGGLPEELLPIFAFTGGMQQTFFDFLEHQSRFEAVGAGMNLVDRDMGRAVLAAYRAGGIVHALMAGRDLDSNWRGITQGVVCHAFKRAWKAGKRYAIAETTSPQSTKLILNLGGRIVLSAAYQKADPPLNQIPLCPDKLYDVARFDTGQPRYSYCRSVLVDLRALATRSGWR